MDKFEIGVSTAAFYPTLLTEDALVQAAEMNFPVVEIFLQTSKEYSRAFAAELDRRRRRLEVRVHSLHLHVYYFDMWSPYARMRAEARDRYRILLEMAAQLEVTALTWHGLSYGFNEPLLTSRFHESLAWAAGKAQEAGVTLCLENVSWCYLRSPEQVEELKTRNLPLGFTYDTFQAGESGVDTVELIRAMGDRITTVHVADYVPEGPRHRIPGEGTLEWPTILRTLTEVGYAGPLILEPAGVSDPETLRAGRRFLRAQAERLAVLDVRC